MSGHGITHSRSQGLIDYAYEFAARKHEGQRRGYSGRPYITHPVSVAKLIASVTEDCDMISAALLHDVLEDTDTTEQELLDEGFGFTIVSLIKQVTNVSKPGDGNRAVRKNLDRLHLCGATKQGKTLKLADVIDNSVSIIGNDPKFAKVYMQEMRELVPCLKEGALPLYRRAVDIVSVYYRLI